MGLSKRGVVLLKNGPEYILGRFNHKTEEAAKGFFTHEVFKLDFPSIWPEFRQFHDAMLSKYERSEQPKSLFFEDGLQVELMDTKRDFSERQIFRDFVTGPLIHCLQSLGSHDGFYEDVNSNDVWIFVDYVDHLIFIRGIKVLAEGVPVEELPEDTPTMAELRKHESSSSPQSIVYTALERLKTNEEILKFFTEYAVWISKYAASPEDKANPQQAVQRLIGYQFHHFGSSTRQKWRNACDFNYKSIAAEFTKLKVVKIPKEFIADVVDCGL